jgi:MFS family permease
MRPLGGSPFAALRHRSFRYFITGQVVSLTGTWMQSVALGWLVLELTNSAFAVGLVSAMGTLPVLLLTLQGGAVASRVNRRRMLVWLQAGLMCEAGVLAVLVWSGHATLGWILLLALAHGSLTAFEIPVRQTFLMDLVGKDDLMNAIAMNSMAFNGSRVIGPAVAGVVTATFGAAACFALNAASYLAVLAALLRIVPDPGLAAPRHPPPPLSEAVRYLHGSQGPRLLVLLAALYTIFGISFVVVLPVYARDVLGTGASGYGALTAAFGLGAVVGALLLAGWGSRLRRGETALASGVVLGAALGVLALVQRYPPAFAVVLTAGAAAASSAIVTNTLLQTEAPEVLRGRIIGFYSFIVVGLSPLGSLLAGWLAEHLGVRAAIGMGGTICLGAAGLALWAWRRSASPAVVGNPVAVSGSRVSPESHRPHWPGKS